MEKGTGRTVVLIPAYQPESRMLALLRTLAADAGEGAYAGILVVDDGSGPAYWTLFEEAEALGCRVVHCAKNGGKGAAIRTGIRAALDMFGEGVQVVTADADGQHLPGDIRRVAQAMEAEKEKEKPALVLGVRDFSGSDVPARSRFGNRVTAAFFRLSTGIRCDDTQTGLRGIPSALLPLALETEGDRYEYEMEFLTAAAKAGRLVQIPIETVYEERNATSHFRPVRDSLLIYKKPLRFVAAAGLSAALDWALFLALMRLFGLSAFSAGKSAAPGAPARRTAASSALSKAGSGIFNFQMNRKWSFQSKGRAGAEAVRYLVLFLGNIACNALAVAGLSVLGLPAAAGKAIADVTLFFVNYQMQKRWVFK